MQNPVYGKLRRIFYSHSRQSQGKLCNKKNQVARSAENFNNIGKTSTFSQSTNFCSLKNSHRLTLSLKPKQFKQKIKNEQAQKMLPLYKLNLLKQNARCRKRIKQLQEKINNQQKMQEFYLQELKYHKQCQKDLQWRLNLIFEELKKHNIISWKNRKESESTVHSFDDQEQYQNTIQFLQEVKAMQNQYLY